MCLECDICDEIIKRSEAGSTYCGHIFHYECLKEWIQRSETCPQCRQTTTEQTIHPVYLSCCHADEVLQNKLDDVQSQLNFKESMVTMLLDENYKLDQQIEKLKKEAAEAINKTRSHNSTVSELLNHIWTLQTHQTQVTSFQLANLELRKEVDDLTNKTKTHDSIVRDLKNQIAFLQNAMTKYHTETTSFELATKELRKENLSVLDAAGQQNLKNLAKSEVEENHSLSPVAPSLSVPIDKILHSPNITDRKLEAQSKDKSLSSGMTTWARAMRSKFVSVAKRN